MILKITKPTALLNESIAKHNIQRMVDKVTRSAVRLRPHFKTPQSAQIGNWFKAAGIDAITVSSVTMAQYFAAHGWQDITIAFPVNWLEIDAINELAASIQLNLLVESPETAQFLDETLQSNVNIWLEIDAGDKRTGIDWQHQERLKMVARLVDNSEKMMLQGLLTHRSYVCDNRSCIKKLYQETVERLFSARDALQNAGFSGLELSPGDTPTCTIVDDFSDVDEIRPGNFVFYDMTQVQMDVCDIGDVAVAVACPVVAVYPERNNIAIYGGGVHLSKEHLQNADGSDNYGSIAQMTDEGWSAVPDVYVTGLSQEHGIIYAPQSFIETVKPGDVLLVLPVHSCMTVDLLKQYQTLNGEIISMMPTLTGA